MEASNFNKTELIQGFFSDLNLNSQSCRAKSYDRAHIDYSR